jgi:hypothetical protein
VLGGDGVIRPRRFPDNFEELLGREECRNEPRIFSVRELLASTNGRTTPFVPAFLPSSADSAAAIWLRRFPDDFEEL